MRLRLRHGTSVSLVLLSLFLISCINHSSDESDSDGKPFPLAIDEHHLAEVPGLIITPENIVIVHLEPANTDSPHQNDTAAPGIDRIPIHFSESTSHDFIAEYREDENFLVKLYHPLGHQLALLDRRSPRATQEIREGEYTIEI